MSDRASCRTESGVRVLHAQTQPVWSAERQDYNTAAVGQKVPPRTKTRKPDRTCPGLFEYTLCLQPLGALDLGQASVERAERQMASLAGGFEHQTIGKAQGRFGAKEFQCRRHDLAVVEHQFTM